MDKRKILIVLTALMMLTGVILSHADSETHSTSLAVGNSAPTISGVGPIANVDLTPGATKTIAINYSVSDNNGVDDIDVAELKVYVTKGGETDRTNTSGDCETSGSGTLLFVTCNVIFQYYDGAGAWDINVTAQDDSAVYVDDKSITVTINALDDVQLNDTAIGCGSALSSPSSDNKCDELAIQNIGNQDYTTVQETAYDLDDDSTGLVTIGAGQFEINTTDVATGTAMIDSSAVTIGGASLTHGAGNEEVLYMYVDIPSGKVADTYTSQSNWQVTVS